MSESNLDFEHKSVLQSEVLVSWLSRPSGLYLDCTVGGAGHSFALLKDNPEINLLALDQDHIALDASRKRLMSFGSRVTFYQSNFRDLAKVLDELYGCHTNLFNGILFDLGVSSPQLDQQERGFSYWGRAKLDMRMNMEQNFDATIIVNTYSEAQLTRILREYGEERWASRIASFIVKERQEAPILTNEQLVEIIKKAIPAAARREGGHPAKRSFQALRIEVNDELGALEMALPVAVAALKPGGKLAVISFHSLEDRIVKQFIREQEHPCKCPPQFPCVCGFKPVLKRINSKPITADIRELEENPRSASAKLRCAIKLPN